MLWRTRRVNRMGVALGLDFDLRLMLQFRGSVVTSDAGLLAYRELEDALGLSETAGERLADARTGKNGRHALLGMLRQAVFGRLAGYEDVNDAERLRHDSSMRWIVGGKAAHGCAASPSQMGRFETRWLTAAKNLSALADRPKDRQGSSPSSAPRRCARHGFEHQPDARRCSCSTSLAIWSAAPCAPEDRGHHDDEGYDEDQQPSGVNDVGERARRQSEQEQRQTYGHLNQRYGRGRR
jgi:hypothetical protein